MAAVVSFIAGDGATEEDLVGSGLGFFGAGGFGFSVQVGDFQDRTFITNGAGSIQGNEVDNNKFLNTGNFTGGGGTSGVTVLGSGLLLTQLQNELAVLNIRFTNDTAVTTQNGIVYIFDRTNKNNDPSGVTCQVAEIIHLAPNNADVGSGDTIWTDAAGSGATVAIADSPGVSGTSPLGPNTSETRHDWFIALTASPDSIGSKTLFGLFVELEFL